MYIVQQCFGFPAKGTEDAVYDSQVIRRVVGIDLNQEAVSDATTLLKFHHLLEAHHLTESIFNAINAHLAEHGLFLREGTIVDATLIAAPPRPRIEKENAIAKCTKPRKASSGLRHEGTHRCRCAIRATLIGTATNVHIAISKPASG